MGSMKVEATKRKTVGGELSRTRKATREVSGRKQTPRRIGSCSSLASSCCPVQLLAWQGLFPHCSPNVGKQAPCESHTVTSLLELLHRD